LNAEVAILMPEKSPLESGKLGLRAAFPPDSEFSQADLAAARWSWDSELPTAEGPTRCRRALAVHAHTDQSFLDWHRWRSAVGESSNWHPPSAGCLEAVGNQAAWPSKEGVGADIDQAPTGR